MDINTVLEAGLRASEFVSSTADIANAVVGQVGDSVNEVAAQITSDCCSSNNDVPTDPAPNR